MKRVLHWFRRLREGEKYFMQKLVDGDIPANNGGWQSSITQRSAKSHSNAFTLPPASKLPDFS
jgi:deoxyribodipyrimidine photolyase